ncbi:hypothetical protein HALLA_03580 (plasmid) [Halostagnicola larsenii XH-48]|uniref:Uncharacterized protein n=1 Tax=Halostagnicola larsenii XH-48 TaxID=797299 RepID=W0JWQ5_9EURY|nr:hypothetical protein [Halostagnicola larsenii]AHG01483.1 hypothetical protein HALLA_03580 [Halostagnicola larsenii XH-48]
MAAAPFRFASESAIGPAAIGRTTLGTTSFGANWFDPGFSVLLLGVIILAALGTTVLFLGSLVAFWRRRTAPYLGITIALALLVIRTLVGFGTLSGVVPMPIHHLVEHSFDFFIAVVILYTAYSTGSPRRTDPPPSESDD